MWMFEFYIYNMYIYVNIKHFLSRLQIKWMPPEGPCFSFNFSYRLTSIDLIQFEMSN